MNDTSARTEALETSGHPIGTRTPGRLASGLSWSLKLAPDLALANRAARLGRERLRSLQENRYPTLVLVMRVALLLVVLAVVGVAVGYARVEGL